MKPFSVICLVLVSLGCDCITEGEGVVIDSVSGHPLDSVLVRSYINRVNDHSTSREVTTDESGTFHGSTGLTGGFFGCPDLVVRLSREGYHDFTIKNPHNDTIKLVRR